MDKYVEVRCGKCGKLLFEASIDKGKVKKICPRCKEMNIYSVPNKRTNQKPE